MSSCKATKSFCFVHTTQYIYKEDKSALERLGRQATFKFRALWSVRDGKGLMLTPIWFVAFLFINKAQFTAMESTIQETPIYGIVIIHMELS